MKGFRATSRGESYASSLDEINFPTRIWASSEAWAVGWQPVYVREAGTRIPGNHGFQQHLIKFENPGFENELLLSGARPQLLLITAHNGARAYHLFAGMLELVCLNGLVAGSEKKHRVPHIGYTDEKVSLAIKESVSHFVPIFEQRERWKALTLSYDQQLAYAEAALRLRFPDKAPLPPQDLLSLRHYEQRENTLWNVMNRVQENIIKGGQPYRSRNGARIRTRPVRSIADNTRLNLMLWRLAENLEDAVVNS